jgi:alkanesulfonate monooxygenase SsuD/methylene tetrahydromethanopterin reductase-like flavin-dependent oxidoreductase (luciferase family)
MANARNGNGAAGGSARAPLRFGIFEWLDRSRAEDLPDLYEHRLKMIELADQAGFYCYHLAEHHGTPLNMAPSPSLFFAALAQRTRRLRFGPMVYLLPLYNPLRLIEEIAMLDQMSRGRFELGVGRGTSPYEVALFNVDPAEARAIFREALDVILMGLRTGRVDHEGQYFQFRNVELPLQPLQHPYPPLWYPTSNASSVQWIAEEGFHTAFGSQTPRLEQVRGLMDQYKAIDAENRGRPDRLNGHAGEPLIGLVRQVYVAETDAQARQEARAAYEAFYENYNYLWALNNNTRHAEEGNFDQRIEDGLFLAGSPETVRRQIEEQVAATGANYFVGAFAFGTFSGEQLQRSVGLFAERVMPAFAQQPSPAG